MLNTHFLDWHFNIDTFLKSHTALQGRMVQVKSASQLNICISWNVYSSFFIQRTLLQSLRNYSKIFVFVCLKYVTVIIDKGRQSCILYHFRIEYTCTYRRSYVTYDRHSTDIVSHTHSPGNVIMFQRRVTALMMWNNQSNVNF